MQFRICAPNKSVNGNYNCDLQRETDFDVNDLGTFVEVSLSKLVPE